MKAVKIGDRLVGEGQPCFIIAEAGSNHNGDLDLALRLIDLAAQVGADAVKFQLFRADSLYSKKAPRLSEMEGRSRPGETPYELLKRLEMPRGWLRPLQARAQERGLAFLTTPFDRQAVEELAKLGVPAYKVSSYDLTDLPLLRSIAAKGQPVLLSTGNSDLGDVERAMEALRQSGNEQVILLHCVSQYPARYEDVNLRALQTLQMAFGVPVGLSDHTLDNVASLGAVALGACVIERHFTLDRGSPGPDHPFALEPEDLGRLVEDVRNLEKALGTGVKVVTQAEEENHRLARKSIHALVPIPKGTRITEDMVVLKRPALGIEPWLLEVVVGREAKQDIEADQWITWSMI